MLPAVKALPQTVESHVPKGPFQYKPIPGIFDSKIPMLESELVDMVDSAINASLREGAKRVSGVLSSYHNRKSLKTSSSVEASTEQTLLEISIRSFTEDDASGQGISVSTTLKDLDAAGAGSESGSLAKQSLNPQQGKAAYAIDAGYSYFVDKLEQKVGSEHLTLTDDRLKANGPGSVPFDDEGHPAQTNVIIEKGTLKSVSHDSRTAAKFKTHSTGNAVWASDIGQIVPVATCLALEAGKLSRDELFEEAEEGLYITNGRQIVARRAFRGSRRRPLHH